MGSLNKQAQICTEGCEGDNFTQILKKYFVFCKYCKNVLQIL